MNATDLPPSLPAPPPLASGLLSAGGETLRPSVVGLASANPAATSQSKPGALPGPFPGQPPRESDQLELAELVQTFQRALRETPAPTTPLATLERALSSSIASDAFETPAAPTTDRPRGTETPATPLPTARPEELLTFMRTSQSDTSPFPVALPSSPPPSVAPAEFPGFALDGAAPSRDPLLSSRTPLPAVPASEPSRLAPGPAVTPPFTSSLAAVRSGPASTLSVSSPATPLTDQVSTAPAGSRTTANDLVVSRADTARTLTGQVSTEPATTAASPNTTVPEGSTPPLPGVLPPHPDADGSGLPAVSARRSESSTPVAAAVASYQDKRYDIPFQPQPQVPEIARPPVIVAAAPENSVAPALAPRSKQGRSAAELVPAGANSAPPIFNPAMTAPPVAVPSVVEPSPRSNRQEPSSPGAATPVATPVPRAGRGLDAWPALSPSPLAATTDHPPPPERVVPASDTPHVVPTAALPSVMEGTTDRSALPGQMHALPPGSRAEASRSTGAPIHPAPRPPTNERTPSDSEQNAPVISATAQPPGAEPVLPISPPAPGAPGALTAANPRALQTFASDTARAPRIQLPVTPLTPPAPAPLAAAEAEPSLGSTILESLSAQRGIPPGGSSAPPPVAPRPEAPTTASPYVTLPDPALRSTLPPPEFTSRSAPLPDAGTTRPTTAPRPGSIFSARAANPTLGESTTPAPVGGVRSSPGADTEPARAFLETDAGVKLSGLSPIPALPGEPMPLRPVATVPEAAPAAGVSAAARLQDYLARSVTRVLVSDPRYDRRQEVRLDLDAAVLPNTSVRLWREGGQLHVEFTTTTAVAESGLREQLPALAEALQRRLPGGEQPNVSLRLGADSGSPEDGRSRQRYVQPEEDNERT